MHLGWIVISLWRDFCAHTIAGISNLIGPCKIAIELKFRLTLVTVFFFFPPPFSSIFQTNQSIDWRNSNTRLIDFYTVLKFAQWHSVIRMNFIPCFSTSTMDIFYLFECCTRWDQTLSLLLQLISVVQFVDPL